MRSKLDSLAWPGSNPSTLILRAELLGDERAQVIAGDLLGFLGEDEHSYEVGDSVTILVDPRGIIQPHGIVTTDPPDWPESDWSSAGIIAAISLTAIVLCAWTQSRVRQDSAAIPHTGPGEIAPRLDLGTLLLLVRPRKPIHHSPALPYAIHAEQP